jgi:hypothetical protein
MNTLMGVTARLRELGPVLLVSMAVVLIGTLAGSLFDRGQRVGAEGLDVPVVTAQPAEGGTQVVDLGGWGVRLVAPLAPELPALRYTVGGGNSVGLSSADLEQVSPACSAGHSGLGTLVRLGSGGFSAAYNGNPAMHYVATIGGHDYAYQSPHNACSDVPAASEIINRETSIIFEALASLAPVTTQ